MLSEVWLPHNGQDARPVRVHVCPPVAAPARVACAGAAGKRTVSLSFFLSRELG